MQRRGHSRSGHALQVSHRGGRFFGTSADWDASVDEDEPSLAATFLGRRDVAAVVVVVVGWSVSVAAAAVVASFLLLLPLLLALALPF